MVQAIFSAGREKGSHCVFLKGALQEVQHIVVRNPSFFCADEIRHKIYVVNEVKEYLGEAGGGITELSYTTRGDIRVDRSYNTGGTDPCHVAIAPNGQFVAVANFASGTISVFGLDETGSLNGKKKVFIHGGKSVHPTRQTGPHAHSIIFAPDGKHFYVPDLGIDKMLAYRYNGDFVKPDPSNDIGSPAGSGPRYGEFSPDGHNFYLVNEIDSSVVHFTCDKGVFLKKETVETLPISFHGNNICADLHLTPNGRYLYVSNRGHNSLACYSIDKYGGLTLQYHKYSGGKTPRNFAIDPTGRWLLAGNQDSDNITVFSISADGSLVQNKQYSWGSPVCLLFLKLQDIVV